MRKTFRYRLYPTKAQAEALTQQLREACTMYNAALQERRDAWKQAGVSISYYDQANQWKAIRAEGLTGLANFSCGQDVLSDGTVISNPRHHERAQARLRRAQRKVARRKKGGAGRKKAVRELQVAYAHVRNQRLDFQHKVARQVVSRFGLIAVEDLNVKGLAGSMLAKSVHDAGWSGFFSKLAYKAESAGRLLVWVDPRGTSQRCSGCGSEVRKELKDRWHACPACGLSVSRDLNSAREIVRLGLSLVGATWGDSPCVPAEAVCLS